MKYPKSVKRNVRNRKTVKRKYKGGGNQGAAQRKSHSAKSARPSAAQLSAAQKAMRQPSDATTEDASLLTLVLNQTDPNMNETERNIIIRKINKGLTDEIREDLRRILARIRLQTKPNGVNGAGIVYGSIKDLRKIIKGL